MVSSENRKKGRVASPVNNRLETNQLMQKSYFQSYQIHNVNREFHCVSHFLLTLPRPHFKWLGKHLAWGIFLDEWGSTLGTDMKIKIG